MFSEHHIDQFFDSSTEAKNLIWDDDLFSTKEFFDRMIENQDKIHSQFVADKVCFFFRRIARRSHS
jgi:hypothetical protein